MNASTAHRTSSGQARQALFRRFAKRGLVYSLGLCLAILALGGTGFWLLEPSVESLHEGLWLAFTTAATVGYGDLVPTTPASRVFAVLVVLVGLAVLSLVTASVAALFVGSEEREIERELMKEIKALRADVAALKRHHKLSDDLARPSSTQTGLGASTTSAAERKASTAVGTPQ